jgi:hypothetical protein
MVQMLQMLLLNIMMDLMTELSQVQLMYQQIQLLVVTDKNSSFYLEES